jgi:hydrogenase maturation protease
MDENLKILILGLGSDILMDDGIGVKIVNDLKSKSDKPNLIYKTSILGGWDLLEEIKGFDALCIIDGIKTKNGIPGDIFRFSLANFRETLHLSNVHDSDFKETLILGNKIGLKLPRIIRIIAVEIEEDTIFGSKLTSKLEENYEQIVEAIETYIVAFIQIFSEKFVLN